jgi:hypothetical protein
MDFCKDVFVVFFELPLPRNAKNAFFLIKEKKRPVAAIFTGRILYPQGRQKPHRLSTNRLFWTSGRFCGNRMRHEAGQDKHGVWWPAAFFQQLRRQTEIGDKGGPGPESGVPVPEKRFPASSA